MPLQIFGQNLNFPPLKNKSHQCWWNLKSDHNSLRSLLYGYLSKIQNLFVATLCLLHNSIAVSYTHLTLPTIYSV